VVSARAVRIRDLVLVMIYSLLLGG